MHVALLPDERAARNLDTHRSRLPAQRLVGARSKLTEDQGWQLSAGDAAEGPRAFAEKRPAISKGR
jgi:hypothetical protein